ncbi:MAG: hypothetical protein VW405_19730 [Rhodospirillaceae bacterium]
MLSVGKDISRKPGHRKQPERPCHSPSRGRVGTAAQRSSSGGQRASMMSAFGGAALPAAAFAVAPLVGAALLKAALDAVPVDAWTRLAALARPAVAVAAVRIAPVARFAAVVLRGKARWAWSVIGQNGFLLGRGKQPESNMRG